MRTIRQVMSIKKAYQQLAALMASYNIHMQQAVNEAEQGICLKPERNFGRGQRNVFAGPLIWRELADKYDGVDQAARDDLATKFTRAVAIDISAMQAADVDNWLLPLLHTVAQTAQNVGGSCQIGGYGSGAGGTPEYARPTGRHVSSRVACHWQKGCTIL